MKGDEIDPWPGIAVALAGGRAEETDGIRWREGRRMRKFASCCERLMAVIWVTAVGTL